MRTPLDSLQSKNFDAAIIGAGINGASAAQHLSAAGYNVLVVDKNDFCSGASSRSSRLIHCGLRYFETPRPVRDFLSAPRSFFTAVRMARQALQTRAAFAEDMAGRYRPIELCFPIRKSGSYRPWHLDMAFRLLGALAPDSLPIGYRRIPASQAASTPLIAHMKDLDQIDSVAIFHDAIMDWPERVGIDMILDAERMGATARNYTFAELGRQDRNSVWNIRLSDTMDPGVPETVVTAQIVLNLAGPWIDAVSRAAQPAAARKVLGTKGTTIAVRLPFEGGNFAVSTLNSKGQPFYCFPWKGLHYFGPTETIFEGDLDDVVATEQEIEELVLEANELFSGVKITRKDVLFTWAGVRPLTYHPKLPMGNRSREIHDLQTDGLDNVFALTAGPVMSYRSAGEALLKVVSSRIEPSLGAKDPNFNVLGFPENQNTLRFPDNDAETRISDLKHAVRSEHAMTLYDVLYRRTGVGWAQVLTLEEIERAAHIVAGEANWDDGQVRREIENYCAAVSKLHTISTPGHPA